MQWRKAQRDSTGTLSCVASYAPPDSLSVLPMWSGPSSPVLSARVCALWLLPGLGLGMHLQGIDGSAKSTKTGLGLGLPPCLALVCWELCPCRESHRSPCPGGGSPHGDFIPRCFSLILPCICKQSFHLT